MAAGRASARFLHHHGDNGRPVVPFRMDLYRHPQYHCIMNITRILGVVLLIVGVILIVVGVTASRSFADNVSNFFTGHFTQTTMWYLIGGIVAAAVGLLLAIGVFGRPRT